MKTFTDNQGRSWRIDVNVASVKRVRDLLDVDLLELGTEGAKNREEEALIFKLIADPVLLCNVIYCLCLPQAEKAKISDEDFGRAMAGDAIDRATKALLEEIVGFFPNPRDRARVGKVLETTWRLIEKAQDVMDARLASGQLERQAEEVLRNLGGSSTNVPESSESTPAASSSGS